MKLFLIIVGALVTAFVLCLLIFVLWLRWLTRNLRGSMKQLGGALENLLPRAPPLRIKLRRTEAIHWPQLNEADALIGPLRKAQFVEIGCFAIDRDGGDVALQAFWQPTDSIYAIVYQHPKKVKMWLDLVTRYQDGSRITYCTERDTLLDRAEHNVIRFHEGMPTADLLARFLAERPSKPIEPMAPELFVAHFEQAYADVMDWFIARGGPTEAEIRRQPCDRRGVLDDEAAAPLVVMAVRASWAAAIDAFYQEQLKERFLAETQPPATLWEDVRQRLLFIHDRLTPERLEALCEDDGDRDDADWGDTPAALAPTEGSASPRAAFARWNATLANERRYEKIGELSEPLAADVYLAPEGDDSRLTIGGPTAQ